MVTQDKKNCQEPNTLLNTSALAEGLRLLFKAMLIIIATLFRLGAAGLAAMAAYIGEKIADTPTVQSGPSAARPNSAADEDHMKVQSGLAAPSPDDLPAESAPAQKIDALPLHDAARVALQAQSDALAQSHTLAHDEADKIACRTAAASQASKAQTTAVPAPPLDRPPAATTAGTLAACLSPAPKAPLLAGTALALVEMSGPFIDGTGDIYNELATGTKVYAETVVVDTTKYLSFFDDNGKEELHEISDDDASGHEDDLGIGPEQQMFIDHNTELPYVTMVDGDTLKKYKRLIDAPNGNTYDVSDSDQSLSDDDDHG